MKPVFLYDAPHYLHQFLADSIEAIPIQYAHNVSGNFLKTQIASNFTKVLQSDIYLVESIRCLLPAIKQKILNPKVKIFCINSDTFFYDYQKFNIVIKKIANFYISFIDYFISTSKYMIQLANKYTKIPHILVYPYVNFEKFSAVKPDLKDKEIGIIGNVCKFRGSDLLLDAHDKLWKKDKNISLKFIGREAERFKIIKENKKQIEFDINHYGTISSINWNICKCINITGRVENPEWHLSLCGTYINPARHDSFGINVLEAMAMGFPPLVSTCVGAKELLPKELIFKPTVNNIVKKYNWLNSNIKRKKLLGKKCQKIAKTFTKERTLKMFKEQYDKIINNNS